VNRRANDGGHGANLCLTRGFADNAYDGFGSSTKRRKDNKANNRA
jgi:hypothetical protein